MANRLRKPRPPKFLGLPDSTRIEVVAFKGKRSFKQEMTIADSRKIKRMPGWTYRNYQLGHSAFKNNKTDENKT